MSGDCCRPGDFDGIFTTARAAKDARSYRRQGIGGESRRIVEEVKARGVRGRSLLEVGGGIGAVQIELLRAGAASAVNVELSGTYETEARRLLEEAGLTDRVHRHVADFVAEADRIATADVVVLDRVVCCYPDVVALVGGAASRARELLVLTLPAERPWMKLGREVINLWPRVTRSRFRFFVHPTRAVVAAAERAGMTLAERSRGMVWQMLVFTRGDDAA